MIDEKGPSINGVWSLTDGPFFSKVIDPLVIINGMEIAMCKGSSRFLVETPSEIRMKITKLTNFPCNGLISTSLDKSAIYRVNHGKDKPVLRIYDKEVRLIAKLTYQGSYNFGQKINFSRVIFKKKV